MLVVISDLHFVDSDRNISADAFVLWMKDVLAIAEEDKAKSLDILFLGDIYDLLRTEQWFDVALEDRPWGDPDINDHPRTLAPACQAQALKILNDIAKQTETHREAFLGRHPDIKKDYDSLESRITIRRLFVPGNHDRLYCVDDAIRARMDELLGVTATGVAGLELHVYRSADERVIARHGHEFDVWNYEGFPDNTPKYIFATKSYEKVPIGDPITTELVARLPYAAREELTKRGARKELIDGVYESLRFIEDVRPVTAAIPWIWHTADEIGQKPTAPGKAGAWQKDERHLVADTVSKIAGSVSKYFMEIPFVKRWIHERDGWGFDEADKLQLLARLLRLGVDVRELSELLKAYDAFDRFAASHADPQRDGAAGEPDLDKEMQYVVYGHTHEFEQTALKIVDGEARIYANSGTWRRRFFLTDDRKNFVSWKNMTYLVFFRADEDLDAQGNQKGTSMLTWTGTMMRRPRRSGGGTP